LTWLSDNTIQLYNGSADNITMITIITTTVIVLTAKANKSLFRVFP